MRVDALVCFERRCPKLLTNLNSLNNVQVRNIQLGVLGSMEILLGYENSLPEEVLINFNTVLLWHQHLEAENI